MAHFAELDESNIVTRVIVVDDSHEGDGQNFLANHLGLGGRWVRTSFNTHGGIHKTGGIAYRKNYAGKGFTFDEERNAFIPPRCHDSATLDDQTCLWDCNDNSHTLNH